MRNDTKKRKSKNRIFSYVALELLMDKWWVILGCSLLCGIAVLIYTTFFITPIYEAKTSLLALRSDADINDVKNNINVSNKLLKDYVILAKSDMTINYAIDSLDLSEEYTIEKIYSQTTVLHNKSSNIITIKVKDKSPENSANIANALVNGLQNTINTVLINSDADNDQFSSVFEKAVVSTKQVYPNIPLSVILALIAGFVIAMLILLISVVFNSNVVSPGQVKLITNLDVLGYIAMFEDR